MCSIDQSAPFDVPIHTDVFLTGGRLVEGELLAHGWPIVFCAILLFILWGANTWGKACKLSAALLSVWALAMIGGTILMFGSEPLEGLSPIFWTIRSLLILSLLGCAIISLVRKNVVFTKVGLTLGMAAHLCVYLSLVPLPSSEWTQESECGSKLTLQGYSSRFNVVSEAVSIFPDRLDTPGKIVSFSTCGVTYQPWILGFVAHGPYRLEDANGEVKQGFFEHGTSTDTLVACTYFSNPRLPTQKTFVERERYIPTCDDTDDCSSKIQDLLTEADLLAESPSLQIQDHFDAWLVYDNVIELLRRPAMRNKFTWDRHEIRHKRQTQALVLEDYLRLKRVELHRYQQRGDLEGAESVIQSIHLAFPDPQNMIHQWAQNQKSAMFDF